MATLRHVMLSIKCWWSGHDGNLMGHEVIETDWPYSRVDIFHRDCLRCGESYTDYVFDD